MQAFEYANPATLKEAVALLGSNWEDAAVLAGGTDLISLMKDYVMSPKRVVNIKNIKELGGVSTSGAGLRIGATATFDDLAGNAAVRTSYPSLHQAVMGVASPQIRNMGTVGGDLCQRPRCWYFRQGHGLFGMKDGKSLVLTGENKYHAIFDGGNAARFVSASSLAPALIALGAKAKVVGPSGVRELEVKDLYLHPKDPKDREITLQPNEILTEVMVPKAAGKNATYEVRHKDALDWPLVTASVVLGKTPMIVLGHVFTTPRTASEAAALVAGKTMTADLAEKAGEAAVSRAQPLSQNAYKVHLAKVAVKRALMAAAGITA
jgi:xanthine dehydrogenase YagS FAD-binding subunit